MRVILPFRSHRLGRLPMFALLLAVGTAAGRSQAQVPLPRVSHAGMRLIPAGTYTPLYRFATGSPTRVAVEAFRLDEAAVTREDYLAFVRTNPAWRRGKVSALFAEPGYLEDWRSALDAGSGATLHQPVTNVSWFGAKAYCAWRGKRLPTADEWEYVATASERSRDATHDAKFLRRLVQLYTQQSTPRSTPARHGFTNVFGVRDLHGVVWEWVADFNSVMASNDSRSIGARDTKRFCASAALGASNQENYAAFLRNGLRASLTARTTMSSLGFRCAAD